ncbi:UDP-N-acetylglucosamine--N-acetylmuramyl-(pentapeptide) pyrophosphoryl-undecaprenol N-acetylglucosamine transferase [Coraliomargarita akajimensis]|uniref:UDP-N-acetylglucosamine--N-acetylmuramyl-(pentapeptide) pyrophosphoryl-undecaprenol N-acetylglucosamine transferase n=1 Tax=Coraliomargarita akajimensis (strain DSM 45221 / IAM 15411 / JCM 23193 / KCTC 12865 / 04OKA010-24) TaxID=583355 RepID=D5EI45_CORAD|nr:UDP-N-acetylglucosamine--N-acetylmuramyl-(pentapeptide) pyrophosphoryl-undecaprenol N-acetylglucosamine transferase [Coraliomargarita akajimensis]ADE56085.1 Undecaprenyldiphospho-muramoylpentapeptidebeta-N -acetylglucosaminyltransferase [Coraliomargarita akajimensis DSM 45221]
MSRFLIACGGTGGHLAPGIAIAEVLQSQGHECVLLISQKQVDSALIQKYAHLSFQKSPGRAFSGGITTLFASAASMLSGLLFARRLIREQQPDVVLLFGGFVSVGLGLAARMARIPVALHEANCMPGKAIRLLKHLATRLYLPDGVRLKGVPARKIAYLGYPVRKEIQHITKAEAWKHLGIEVPGKLLVLIGGSQGAQALNEWVVDHAKALAEHSVSVYCVTGLGKGAHEQIEHVNQAGQSITATFVPFSDAMGHVISAADLVVSRAGAGAIAEIIRCRAPSILIPYPFAADDHQMANARFHEQHGAGVLIVQDDLDNLLSEVESLMYNDWLLKQFKSNMERMEAFDSGERIAADLIQLADAAKVGGVL